MARDPSDRGRAVRFSEEATLVEQLSAIREQLLEVAEGWSPWVQEREADRDASARNLLQYLALRGRDLRGLQEPLIALGLSSLGGSEGHVQASVDAVLEALRTLIEHPPPPPPRRSAPIGFTHSRELLAARTAALLGPSPRERPTRIMVTMPTEAAGDPDLVRDMLARGMDCMRINCAHDAAPEWRAMRQNLRLAEEQTRRRARVVVDLPGPKLRTGPLAPKQTRDSKGDYLRLAIGDRLILTRDGDVTPEGVSGAPARICCSLDEAFAVTRPGHHVWLDDGKLGGVVESAGPDSIELRITSAAAKGSKLRAGKGINLPDAVLDIDLLGSHSADALLFAAEAADIVGLSFISGAREVQRVSEYLDRHARPEVGMILKIETRRAFEHLPGMLLAALGGERPAGVMIARGDLAVECGYERLAEVQEEILWLCQAAHMPVIWATQVLDRLAKTGRPSRAEITDAAMGVQAECVMLNKGPRILEAISVLDDILRRMERHHRKQRPLLPQLRAADYVHTKR
ncbi:MAG: pyruvate kinase [Solirubrobacteraceae bacterium]